MFDQTKVFTEEKLKKDFDGYVKDKGITVTNDNLEEVITGAVDASYNAEGRWSLPDNEVQKELTSRLRNNIIADENYFPKQS